MDQHVQQVDLLSEAALGDATNPEERRAAEEMLKKMQTIGNLEALRYVLERSNSQLSTFVCAKGILDIITENWNGFAQNNKHIEMREWLIRFIGQKGSSLTTFTRTVVMTILCRIVKLGWLAETTFQDFPKEIHKLFLCNTSDPSLPVLGYMLINQLVLELNMVSPKMTLSQHRKTMTSFRDSSLLDCFKVALSILQQSLNSAASDSPEQAQAIGICLSCLTFDFIGNRDEIAEELGAIQIPTTWKQLLVEADSVDLFWKLYSRTHQTQQGTDILKCIVQLAGVRITKDKEAWLAGLLYGMLIVLQEKIGLENPGNNHEFCRLLSKIKPNFQVDELASCKHYTPWVKAVAVFTTDCFTNWRDAPHISYFLLAFWARLVNSQQYNNSGNPTHLESITPRVVESYIVSRLAIARSCIESPGEYDDALEDQEALLVQLESFPIIARSMYDDISAVLKNFAGTDFEAMHSFAGRIQRGEIPPEQHPSAFIQLQVIDARLSWLVYMMGSIFVGNHRPTTPDMVAHRDGELMKFVVDLSSTITLRVESIPNQLSMQTLQRLQLAVLYFLKSFRKVYMGDTMLDVIVDILFGTFATWKKCSKIIHEAMSLFMELSVGTASASVLVKFDKVKAMVSQHSHPQFNFIEEPENIKQRMRFYNALANLFFKQTTDENAFNNFMNPVKERAERLASLPPDQLTTPQGRHAVIALLRDLRGVCSACITKRSYSVFFNWVFPYISLYDNPNTRQTPVFHSFCELFSSDNEVLIPLLRFWAELVDNSGHRIQFEVSSPFGILLFREASAVVKHFGDKKLAELCGQQPPDQPWHIQPCTSADRDKRFMTYKVFVIYFMMLGRALNGGYCNFGVFTLYSDNSWNVALEKTIKLVCFFFPSSFSLPFLIITLAEV